MALLGKEKFWHTDGEFGRCELKSKAFNFVLEGGGAVKGKRE